MQAGQQDVFYPQLKHRGQNVIASYEVVAVVEDLKTLRSSACVRITAKTENDGVLFHDMLTLIEVPE